MIVFSPAQGCSRGHFCCSFFPVPPLPGHICDSVIHKYDLTCVACLRMSHRRWKVLNKLLMSVRQCDVRAPWLRQHHNPATEQQILPELCVSSIRLWIITVSTLISNLYILFHTCNKGQINKTCSKTLSVRNVDKSIRFIMSCCSIE